MSSVFRKQSNEMDSSVSGNETSSSDVQFCKTARSRCKIPCGMTIFLKLLHPRKAPAPNAPIVSGITISFNPAHPANAFLPIVRTLLGSTIFSILTQAENAQSAIDSVPSSIRKTPCISFSAFIKCRPRYHAPPSQVFPIEVSSNASSAI